MYQSLPSLGAFEMVHVSQFGLVSPVSVKCPDLTIPVITRVAPTMASEHTERLRLCKLWKKRKLNSNQKSIDHGDSLAIF